ncbi:choice-of-anchor U domain-containing protein [Thermus scotoductus]|uniref:choice-of-anchor U domain-containing protein n=1 Tax=Thermus scotoductus TaxID=37636 RepID=UPI000F8031BB|nr:fibronectin type III domain-containing protein [Thermus scotoductus]
MRTSKVFGWLYPLALALLLLLAACGSSTGGGSGSSTTSGTVNTPGGQVQVALQGGSFTQGPTSAQVNPQGYQTPYGGISFTAQVPQAGGTLTVTLTFPQDLPQGAVLLKCTSSTACNPIQWAQIQGRTATFQVRDGGPLDADGQANGRIQDPVALGVPNPDFTIALDPDTLTVQQGSSGTTTLTLTPQNGFTGQVTLTLERQDGTSAPSGISLSPGSVNVAGSGPVTQTLTVSVESSVAAGSYALRVKATSGDLTRYANLSLTVTAPPTPPAAPSELRLTPSSPTAIDLRWTDNSDNEEGFRLERSTDGTNFSVIATLPANTTTYTDTLPSPTTYYYRVKAFNTAGESSPSNVATNSWAKGYLGAKYFSSNEYQ